MRVARFTAPGVFYHCIWRFVDRRWFFQGDDERSMYLLMLERALRESDWRCMAYALMSNHIHLGMLAGREQLGRWAKRVSTPFAQWMNRRHDRLGPVMADRPKSCAVRAELEPHVFAYIHNNPVRAGVVARPGDSSWTSHRLYTSGATTFVAVEEALSRWGFADSADVDLWTTNTPGESGFPPTRRARNTARRLGAIEAATPIATSLVPLVARPFAHVRVDPQLLAAVAAWSVGATVRDLGSRRRNPQLLAGRYVAVALADHFGVSGSDIAAALGMSGSAICWIRRRTPTRLASEALPGAFQRVEIELTSLIEDRPSTS